MATKFRTELADDELTFVVNNSQLIANEVSREDKVKAQANLEAMAAGFRTKSEALRERLRPLWRAAMKIVSPSWRAES